MVDAPLDSSVLIDLLRGYAPAEVWLEQREFLGVTHIVWLELLEGAKNKQSQHKAIVPLRRFHLVETIPSDFEWEVNRLVMLGLSHQVDAFDCLIASVSYRLNVPLYTRNMKHFVPLISNLAPTPYG